MPFPRFAVIYWLCRATIKNSPPLVSNQSLMEFFDLWQYWRLTLRLHGSMENPSMSATGKQQKRPAMCHRVSTQVIMNTDLLSVWNHNSNSVYYISAVRCKQQGMLSKYPITYFLWSVNESIRRVLRELSISGNSGLKYHENVNIPHCAGICVTKELEYLTPWCDEFSVSFSQQ